MVISSPLLAEMSPPFSGERGKKMFVPNSSPFENRFESSSDCFSIKGAGCCTGYSISLSKRTFVFGQIMRDGNAASF